jgi:hypothetical protein
MDEFTVFKDSPERGTTCSICHVEIQAKTPSSKARHLKTKMHRNAIQLATTSKYYLPKEQEESKRKLALSDDAIVSDSESMNHAVSFHDSTDFYK